MITGQLFISNVRSRNMGFVEGLFVGVCAGVIALVAICCVKVGDDR